MARSIPSSATISKAIRILNDRFIDQRPRFVTTRAGAAHKNASAHGQPQGRRPATGQVVGVRQRAGIPRRVEIIVRHSAGELTAHADEIQSTADWQRERLIERIGQLAGQVDEVLADGRVMAQSVDPTQPSQTWRFTGTSIPFE